MPIQHLPYEVFNIPTTYMFGSTNQSCGFAYDDGATTTSITTCKLINPSSFSPFISEIICPHLTWSTLWFSLLCLFIAFNAKHMPFMWHMRLVNAFRFVLRTQRSRVPPSPKQIFQPLITTSTAQLMEIDFNVHKTNSSYFADLDIARAHLVCTLFSRGIEKMRGGTEAWAAVAPGSKKQPMFGLALGAVSCSFRRELRPYEDYEMWTRLLAWDEKWVYIVTHFVKAGVAEPGKASLYPEQTAGKSGKSEKDGGEFVEPGKHIYATAISKCVFKSGRKTVAPELMLQLSGLLPPLEGEEGQKEEVKPDMTLEEVEEQRQKGLKIAEMLSGEYQQCLEAKFEGSGSEVLGKHTDGAGIVGVVSTLMQLARLKKSQML